MSGEEKLMSMLELTEFAGKAQVLGLVREVVVAGGKLEIRGVNIAEAQRILNHLAIGLFSMKLPEPAPAQATAPETQAAPEAKTSPTSGETKDVSPKRGRNKTAPTPELAVAVAETAPAPAPAAAKPPVEDDLPGTLGQNGQGPQPGDNVVSPPLKAAETTAPAPTVPAAPAGGDDELVAKLITYKRLGDILLELNERGYATPAQMTAFCEKVQTRVPVLNTIPNLADRIERSWNTQSGKVSN